MDAFSLDPRILETPLPVTRLALCTVRLMNNRRYPWILLIPERAGLREIHDLDQPSSARLVEEIVHASRALETACAAQKINIGALGNIVPQLHVHVVGRFEDDAAWWRDHAVTTEHLAEVRREFAISFGSCSFEEPVADLRALGLI